MDVRALDCEVRIERNNALNPSVRGNRENPRLVILEGNAPGVESALNERESMIKAHGSEDSGAKARKRIMPSR